MSFADRVAERWPEGFLVAAASATLKRLKGLSLSRAIARSISTPRTIDAETKVPAWIGDTYVLACVLLAGLVAGSASASWPPPVRWLVIACLAYRCFELVVFLLGWLLVDSGPLHSYRRSVMAYVVNLTEVALIATALDALLGCRDAGPWPAFWEHFAAMVSLDGSGLADRAGACQGILVGRFTLGAIILLLALGVLVGGLSRKDLHGRGG